MSHLHVHVHVYYCRWEIFSFLKKFSWLLETAKINYFNMKLININNEYTYIGYGHWLWSQ